MFYVINKPIFSRFLNRISLSTQLTLGPVNMQIVTLNNRKKFEVVFGVHLHITNSQINFICMALKVILNDKLYMVLQRHST